MGRNILILADGTGNEGGLLPDESRTNVYKLFRAVRVDPDSGIKPSEQLSFYVRGIGTPSPGHTSWMQRRRERIQQIVGMGLTQKITDCLVAIISAWRPGDRIYLFGFSRGAYTVRCLAHVLELLGIPTTEDDGKPISFEPKALHSLARKAVGILYKWGLPAKNVPRRDSEAEIFRYKHSCKVGAEIGATPYFIGLWDTVAAIGWTHLLKIKYDLHYPKDVRFARHAMAIDEYRKDFVRVQWGGSGTIPDPRPGEPFPFEQVWFAGNHADIGGSYPENESRLSDIPLKWMADFVELELPPEGRVQVNRERLNCFPEIDGMMHDECMVGIAGSELRWPHGEREVPMEATLHPTVYERLKMPSVRNFVGYGKYRPASLRNHAKAKAYFSDVTTSPV
jgi:uncharacterized protein (DUF2235 family)